MPRSHHLRYPLLAWAGWLMVSLFLQAGPVTIRDQLQATAQTSTALLLDRLGSLVQWSRADAEMTEQEAALVRDLLSIANDDSSISEKGLSANGAQRVLSGMLSENRELLRRVAELELENSQLQQTVPYSSSPRGQLVALQAVPARIIGRRGDVLSESLELLISLGKEQGLAPGELVLSGRGLLIDQGAAQGLSPDQLLTAGRALFGRTIRVGRQTSLVQPMTDIDFRMAVRIVRRSTLGVVQGPTGILTGTGSGCRLDEVAATEAVAAGDDVYTDRLVSPGAEPIYCGRILSARAEAGDNHWTIQMAPVHTPASLPAELSVLTVELAAARRPAPTP